MVIDLTNKKDRGILNMECDFRNLDKKCLFFYTQNNKCMNQNNPIILPNDIKYNKWYPFVCLFYGNKCKISFQ